MSTESIFTKIVKGDIPCYKLHEDDQTLTFLDINPVTLGHCLVICKEQYPAIEDVPDELLVQLIKSVKKVGTAIKQALGVSGYNLLVNNGPVAGQEVPHLHFHIIPRRENDGFRLGWKQGSLDKTQAEELISKVTAAL